MKNLKLWIVILSAFTAACSSEHISQEPDNVRGGNGNSINDPSNPANPYDSAGLLYNEILQGLSQTDLTSYTTEEIAIIVDTASAATLESVLLPNPSLSGSVPQINWIVSNDDPAQSTMPLTALSSNAKASFLSFLDSLVINAKHPYDDLHTIIISYEAYVMANAQFTPQEKRIILIATSVARYDDSTRKRKDKDWETSTTSVVGAVVGAQQNISLGIKMGVAVAIIHNQP